MRQHTAEGVEIHGRDESAAVAKNFQGLGFRLRERRRALVLLAARGEPAPPPGEREVPVDIHAALELVRARGAPVLPDDGMLRCQLIGDVPVGVHEWDEPQVAVLQHIQRLGALPTVRLQQVPDDVKHHS
eukprot:CAMPEP_0198558966 /NCGR_PEP_ID=MMETSP1462-20131121/91437_1 /TAXON_ID=1333877 /ORGANISM="Brandtodinium nutriculum, Strain RCC3387" /LENGTH=129 /DNA_ID=CAMNT_0044289803 /DNA_START=406 /DNA_END=795 /DNA_ORIENTATION=-